MDTFLYGILDAPSIPIELIKQNEIEFTKQFDQYEKTGEIGNLMVPGTYGNPSTKQFIAEDGKVYTHAINRGIFLTHETQRWVRENITASFNDARYAHTMPGREKCCAHCDKTRNYTLIYLLETGGPNHMTNFYKDKDSDEIFGEAGTYTDDYSTLEHIAGIKLKVGKWNLLQARVRHSIDGIGEGRKAIQVSLNDFDPDFKLTNIIRYINV